MDNIKIRTIYGRRQSRPLNPTQKILWEDLFAKISICPDNLPEVWPNEIIFEIGFGAGENLLHQAINHPNALCIGCEPFINGVASLLHKINEARITNIKVFDDDAKLLLHAMPDYILSQVFILFPDPWPKKRHHRRRVVCLEHLLLVHQKMKKGGKIVIATDHPGYLEWMIEMTKMEKFQQHFEALNSLESPRPSEAYIPVTRYEKKALENRPGAFLMFLSL